MASIYKRSIPRQDGKPTVRWVVTYRDPDGTQRRKTFRSKSDALTFRDQAGVSVRAGVTPGTPAGPSELPLREASTLTGRVEAWQGSRRVSRARTAAESSLAKRLHPLSDLPVTEVTPSIIRGHLADLTDQGYSPETVSAVLRLLRQVLDQTVEDGLLQSNPAARVRPPKIVRPPLDSTDVLTVAEAHQLVHATPTRWQALVAVLVFTGARWSEALALQRQDVDLIRGRLHLGHRVVEEVAGSTVLRDGGKTRGSDRIITLPAVVLDQLRDHIEAAQPAPDGLLFLTTRGTSPLRGNFRRQVWQTTVREAGLEDRGITVRQLRHTAASIMLQAGLDPLDVARRLGHSRPSTTLDIYARLLPTEDSSTQVLDRHLQVV